MQVWICFVLANPTEEHVDPSSVLVMTTFHQIALLLILVWFTLIVLLFRRSTLVLVAGLIMIGLYTVVSIVSGQVP